MLDKEVEEVQVQDGLDDATRVHHPVVGVEGLVVRPPDPVEDVQESIHAKEEDELTGDVLHLSEPLQQDELGQDGDGFYFRPCLLCCW